MNYGLTDEAIRKLICHVNENKDRHYTHNQTTSSATWNITHNLGKYPSIEVVDTAGSMVIGDVTYNDINNVTITFTSQFKGKAYLN